MMASVMYTDLQCLQGQFSHWLARTPLERTFWSDFPITSLPNLTKHTYSHGHYYKIANTFYPILSFKQPDMSPSNNCSAALLAHFYFYTWVTIPCDTQYNASILC